MNVPTPSREEILNKLYKDLLQESVSFREQLVIAQLTITTLMEENESLKSKLEGFRNMEAPEPDPEVGYTEDTDPPVIK